MFAFDIREYQNSWLSKVCFRKYWNKQKLWFSYSFLSWHMNTEQALNVKFKLLTTTTCNYYSRGQGKHWSPRNGVARLSTWFHDEHIFGAGTINSCLHESKGQVCLWRRIDNSKYDVNCCTLHYWEKTTQWSIERVRVEVLIWYGLIMA